MWWRRISEAWTRRPDIPSWFPNVLAVAILIGVAALVLPALRKGGSYTISYEKLADVTANTFRVHIERFKSRPGGFYFALPVPEMERSLDGTQSFAGVAKVSSGRNPVVQYEFTTILFGSERLRLEPNDGGKFSTLLLVQFNGERTPKELRGERG